MRSRLLAGQVLLLTAVCAGVGAATGFGLHQFLMDKLDGQLTYTERRAVQLIGLGMMDRDGHPVDIAKNLGAKPNTGPGPDFIGAPGQPLGTLGAILEDDLLVSGGTVASSDSRTALSATVATELAAVPVDGQPGTRWIPGLGRYRVIAQYTPQGQIIVVGMPLNEVRGTVFRMLRNFAIVTGLALVAAATAGILLLRRELGPLHRVAATATHVADLKLDRGEVILPVRVPVADADPRTEIGQLGMAVNQMLTHIAGALSARHDSETRVRQFLADASHELRTPLTAIRGYTELAQRNRSAVSAEVANAMGRVESEAKRMTHLVEDMLLLARLDSGRPLEREQVDLSALTVDAVSDAHIAGPDHRWNLDLPEVPVFAVGDAPRLHQVLVNLLANARIHTGPGTSVTVWLAAEAGGAIWRVIDSGPGIPAAAQPTVFERFSRGDSSRSRKAGSTGLGLSIVAAVVKAHGGTITVHSVPGHTEFVIRLPGAATHQDS